jgi:hypothetical protein
MKTTASMLCCVSGDSYAKAGANAATCFQHIAPGTTAAQCDGAPSASGYYSCGAKSARLFLAQSSSSCSDTLQVGTAQVTCPEGNTTNKVGFTVVTAAPHRCAHAQLNYKLPHMLRSQYCAWHTHVTGCNDFRNMLCELQHKQTDH